MIMKSHGPCPRLPNTPFGSHRLRDRRHRGRFHPERGTAQGVPKRRLHHRSHCLPNARDRPGGRRPPEIAREDADLYGIPKVYDTVGELLRDPQIEIVDVAVPPDQQLAVIREVARHASHVRGILVQKPLALNYAEAVEIVRICRESGIRLAVNQNMRYDQSIRALKSLLKKGYLGEPVLATIDMRAVPHWQPWVREYSRLTLLNMSVHHLDCFRFLFGEPECVYASV